MNKMVITDHLKINHDKKNLTEQHKTIIRQITLECVLYVYDTMGWCFMGFCHS